MSTTAAVLGLTSLASRIQNLSTHHGFSYASNARIFNDLLIRPANNVAGILTNSLANPLLEKGFVTRVFPNIPLLKTMFRKSILGIGLFFMADFGITILKYLMFNKKPTEAETAAAPAAALKLPPRTYQLA
jgi:hypothetical protein